MCIINCVNFSENPFDIAETARGYENKVTNVLL